MVMKLHSLNFGVAVALTAAIIWLFCSLFVFSAPQFTMMLSGNMIHMDTTSNDVVHDFCRILVWAFSLVVYFWNNDMVFCCYIQSPHPKLNRVCN